MKFTEKLGNFFCCDSYTHQEKHLSLLCMFMFFITFLLFYLSTFGTKQLNDIFPTLYCQLIIYKLMYSVIMTLFASFLSSELPLFTIIIFEVFRKKSVFCTICQICLTLFGKDSSPNILPSQILLLCTRPLHQLPVGQLWL